MGAFPSSMSPASTSGQGSKSYGAKSGPSAGTKSLSDPKKVSSASKNADKVRNFMDRVIFYLISSEVVLTIGALLYANIG